MTESYLQVLVESLEKKNEVLDKLMELDDRQAMISLGPDMDVKAYDESMEEKGKLIDEINRLDEGFATTYEIIKDEVKADPSKYKDTVLYLQDLIREAIDKGTSIEAKESRNRLALDKFFKSKRSEVKQQRVSTAAATKYYKAMSKINNVDPQLMDRKK